MSDSTRPVAPQEVLPDGVECLDVAGATVRKGTVAAFVANVTLLHRLPSGTAAHEAVVAQLRDLVPAMRAIGLFDVFEPKSEQVRVIVAGA